MNARTPFGRRLWGLGSSIAGGAWLFASATAPFQCASDPPVSGVREDTPAEAVKQLADEFKKSGDRAARVRTLRFLIERYPRSNLAEEAKAELAELGEVSPAPSGSAAPSAAPAPSAAASASASATKPAP